MSGPGPLGAKTNSPKIDKGTSCLNCHKPPVPTGSSPVDPKLKLTYFDIRQLFPTMDVLGWNTGKKFMKFWADGERCVAKNKKSSGAATIGVNVSNKCMRIYELDWKWLLSFKLASEQLKKFQRQRVFNDAAKALIIKQYGKLHTMGKFKVPFNDWLKDGFPPASFRPVTQTNLMI